MELKYLMMIIIMITMMLFSLSFILSEKIPDKEKNDMYECGFTPMLKMGNPFSMSFFIIAMLFLVFDLEIILLFPWSMLMYNINTIIMNFYTFIFIFFLTMGLMYEWYNGGLEWDKFL